MRVIEGERGREGEREAGADARCWIIWAAAAVDVVRAVDGRTASIYSDCEFPQRRLPAGC